MLYVIYISLYYLSPMYMRNNLFTVLSDQWTPSTFYDGNTELIWVNNYSLFVRIYEKRVRAPEGKRYAIHKDVYQAFVFKYKNSNGRKGGGKRRTRRKRDH